MSFSIIQKEKSKNSLVPTAVQQAYQPVCPPFIPCFLLNWVRYSTRAYSSPLLLLRPLFHHYALSQASSHPSFSPGSFRCYMSSYFPHLYKTKYSFNPHPQLHCLSWPHFLKEVAGCTIAPSRMPSPFPSVPLMFDFHPSSYPDTAGQSHWYSSCCNCQEHPAVLSSLGLLKAWPCWSLQFWEASSHSFYKPPPIPVFLLPPGCSFYVSYGLSSPSSYLTHHQMLSVSQTGGLWTLFTLHADTWTSHPLPLFVRMYNVCVCDVQTWTISSLQIADLTASWTSPVSYF